jgi:hypothetical protein
MLRLVSNRQHLGVALIIVVFRLNRLVSSFLVDSPPTVLSRCEASYCTGNTHVYFFRAPGNFLILRPPGASPAPTEKAGEPCLESAGPAAPALKLNPALAVPGVPGVPGVDPNIPD